MAVPDCYDMVDRQGHRHGPVWYGRVSWSYYQSHWYGHCVDLIDLGKASDTRPDHTIPLTLLSITSLLKTIHQAGVPIDIILLRCVTPTEKSILRVTGSSTGGKKVLGTMFLVNPPERANRPHFVYKLPEVRYGTLGEECVVEKSRVLNCEPSRCLEY
jgi:hypothetical protein